MTNKCNKTTVRPLAERVASRTDRSGGVDACWPWLAGASNGRGKINVDGKKINASRAAWIVANGRPIPGGMFVCHRCDNPICVNPAHLFLGTHKDNMADMRRKGRGLGARRRNAKLSLSRVAKLRQLSAAGWSQRRIARRFGVTQSIVWRVLSGRGWRIATAST